MAEGWIKLDKSTPSKPEVFAVAKACGVSLGDAFLGIVKLFIWADDNTEDGIVRNFSAFDAEQLTNVCGIGAELLRIGWLKQRGEDMEFCNWERHNGRSAKRRSLDLERKKVSYSERVSSKRDIPQSFRKNSASKAEEMRNREEKRREDIKENHPHSSDGEKKSPAGSLPSGDLGGGELPGMPEVSGGNGQRDTRDSKGVGGGGCFRKPSVEEVASYCRERGNGIDPAHFCDFYESKGWKVGREPMKDWRAAVRTWEQRQEPGREGKQDWRPGI